MIDLIRYPCGLAYVVKILRQLRTRISENHSDIKTRDMRSPRATHFRQVGHNISVLQYIGIEKVIKPSRGGDYVKKWLQREYFWIYTLNALSLSGLNEDFGIKPFLQRSNHFFICCWLSVNLYVYIIIIIIILCVRHMTCITCHMFLCVSHDLYYLSHVFVCVTWPVLLVTCFCVCNTHDLYYLSHVFVCVTWPVLGPIKVITGFYLKLTLLYV